MLLLSIVSGLTLSFVVGGLQERKLRARELDKSEQLLIAAKIYSPKGFFLLPAPKEFLPAKEVRGRLVPGTSADRASPDEVLEVYNRRVRPMVVSPQGQLMSYKQANIDQNRFLEEWKLSPQETPWLPIYVVSQDQDAAVDSYVIPVFGFGLWDKIFGYIAICPDGKTVRGISWYEHKETPGLGGTIADPAWQMQFFQKQIFQPDESGNVDMETSPIGITVVKGKVSDVMGSSPASVNAVDGMAGATLTGVGVARAYKESLDPYRNFFVSLASHKGGEHL